MYNFLWIYSHKQNSKSLNIRSFDTFEGFWYYQIHYLREKLCVSAIPQHLCQSLMSFINFCQVGMWKCVLILLCISWSFLQYICFLIVYPNYFFFLLDSLFLWLAHLQLTSNEFLFNPYIILTLCIIVPANTFPSLLLPFTFWLFSTDVSNLPRITSAFIYLFIYLFFSGEYVV